jgi:hypothetical protein
MGGKDEDEEGYGALIYRERSQLRKAEAAAAAANSTKKKKKKANKTAKKKKKLYWSDGFITSYVKQRTSPPQ